jgi:hypothetical protein
MEEEVAKECWLDLTQFYGFILEFTEKDGYTNLERPKPSAFEYSRLKATYESEAAVQSMAAEARHSALDYLGFLNWWMACVPSKIGWLSTKARNKLRDVAMENLPKRGVLLRLLEDWSQINLPVLVYHDMPVCYEWEMPACMEKRFAQLNPSFLKAYDSAVQKAKRPIPLAEMPKTVEMLDDLRGYNSFLEEIDGPFIPRNDTSDYITEESWFVIDHEIWHRQPITKAAAVQMDQEGHEKFIKEWEGKRIITYLQWRVCQVISIRTNSDQEDIYDNSIPDDFDEGLTDVSEIIEFYKGQYAPWPGEEVDPFLGLLLNPPELMEDIKMLDPVETQHEELNAYPYLTKDKNEEIELDYHEDPPLFLRISEAPVSRHGTLAGVPTEPLVDRIGARAEVSKLQRDAPLERGRFASGWAQQMARSAESPLTNTHALSSLSCTWSMSPLSCDQLALGVRERSPPGAQRFESRNSFIAHFKAWGREIIQPGRLWDFKG